MPELKKEVEVSADRRNLKREIFVNSLCAFLVATVVSGFTAYAIGWQRGFRTNMQLTFKVGVANTVNGKDFYVDCIDSTCRVVRKGYITIPPPKEKAPKLESKDAMIERCVAEHATPSYNRDGLDYTTFGDYLDCVTEGRLKLTSAD